MPELFVFLLKVNAALLLFCLGYYLVLRRLTFYTLNRIYLVSAILFASIYPRINLSGFAGQHRQLAPVQNMLLNWKAPAQNLVKLNEPNYWHLAEVLFWMGAVLFATRLVIQLFSLYKLYRGSKPGNLNGYEVRLIDGDINPFSFWQSIYINPANLDPGDLKNILQHEQVHVKQWHTLDILLAELSAVFYWFNPGVWLMKKAIRENIEFITDRKILQKGTDSRQYQYSMLNVSLANNQSPIVNHFNISTIKKRIIMMNTKRSSRFNLTRYALVLPAVIVLLLIFSFSEAGISKKSRNVLKNMAINVSALKMTSVINTDIKTTGQLPAKHNNTIRLQNPDTVTKVKTTGKQLTVTNVKTDSVVVTDAKMDAATVYIIDGKKVSKAELKLVDPKKISNVAVVWGKDAKQFTADTNQQVFVINTKDTLKADMGKRIVIGYKAPRVLTKIKINDVASALPKDTIVVNLSDDALPPPDGDLKPGTVRTYSTTVTGLAAGRAAPSILIKELNATSSRETNIDGFSDKLIFINGKEASGKDMKKLRAADIKSINVNKDPKTKKKYGDKAKNGVIFITTKK